MDNLGGEFNRSLKFPKGYVATRWLSLQQFVDSCVASAYPLYKYRERFVNDGWGASKDASNDSAGSDGALHGGGGDGDGGADDDGPPEAAVQYKLMKVAELEASAKRRNPEVKFTVKDEKLCKKNLLAWYKKKHDQGDDLTSTLSEYAQLVFSVPFETVLIESLFSIMNYSKSGRRCSMGDTAVENAIHLRSAPPVVSKDDKDKPFGPGETTPDEIHLRNFRGADLGGAVDLRYDTSAAHDADLTKLSSFTAADTAVQTMPTPPASKVPFKCYAEDWETTTDKRQRRGQEWRTRYKYVGMVFEDKEKDEKRRVVGAKWHSDRKEVNAGWALETMLADSHTERELYHVLSVRDDADDDDEEEEEEEDVPPHYDLFGSFKPEHNKHRPFESKA